MSSLIDETEQGLESFWSTHIGSIASQAWSPPSDVVVYTEDATPTGSPCIADGSPEWENNSFYCGPNSVIYLDTDWLEQLGHAFPSNPAMAPVIIQAHEFGHHLESLAAATYRLDIGKELQADCYAGVFLDGLDKGDVSVDVGDVDVRGALDTIRGIGDTRFADDSWFKEGVHGGPPERAQAMATGYLTGDPSLCSGYEVTGPIRPLTLGGYTFRPPPAASFRPLQNAYRMTNAAQPSFTADLQNWTNLSPGAVEALKNLAPDYFKGATVRYVGGVEDFGRVAGYGVANLRYEQTDDSGTYHGVIVLVTRGDGTGLVIDVYEAGGAPSDDNGPDWTHIGNYAFSTLWGITG